MKRRRTREVVLTSIVVTAICATVMWLTGVTWQQNPAICAAFTLATGLIVAAAELLITSRTHTEGGKHRS